jgi:hypothetical protein
MIKFFYACIFKTGLLSSAKTGAKTSLVVSTDLNITDRAIEVGMTREGQSFILKV